MSRFGVLENKAWRFSLRSSHGTGFFGEDTVILSIGPILLDPRTFKFLKVSQPLDMWQHSFLGRAARCTVIGLVHT